MNQMQLEKVRLSRSTSITSKVKAKNGGNKTLAMNAAKGESNILIQGESGTGKEVIARAIHQMSSRADQPLSRSIVPLFLKIY